MSKFIMKKALEEIDKGNELAIATIIDASGSTPREAGAKMIVLKNGKTYGTVGGGAMEKRIIELSLEAIEKGKSEAISLPLDAKGVEMICGGAVEVFIEVYKSRPKLLIAGGGHVGYAIYNAALPLDFDIVIFEDREEFLNSERFPEAYELVLGDIGENLRDYPIDENTYIVIVTRGHKYDEEALAMVANSDAKYIGAMGSKKKVITMFKNLKERGIDSERLKSTYSPVGLKISTNSPEEIAISILAEILAVKNSGKLVHMRDELHREKFL